MATWAVVFFAAGPLAALFQVGYAESLFLLWLFLALWCVMRRRYGWLYLLIPLMGFTRPGVLAFALFLGLHGIHRWFTRRTRTAAGARHRAHRRARRTRDGRRDSRGRRSRRCGRGMPGAYLSTELAWRRNWIVDPPEHFVPFEGFALGARFWAGSMGDSRGCGLRAARRPGGRGRRPADLRAARQASRSGSATVVRELPPLPAGRLLPAVEHLPPARSAVAAVGCGRRCRGRPCGASACSPHACSGNGGGSTRCMPWRVRPSGPSPDQGEARDPASERRDRLDEQTYDEREPRWQP